ncbi:hypothetical protein QMM42_02980 [Leptospira santarosai]|uniref:Uncharacterized protein n=1 Tax=Leptospira santarosai serovar Arenal str. MAVJ 401 TaxID=1049976 RepID=M6K7F9_9LEPT|nr:hypothetical protein [Leptospira santarosai]EMN23672.1 hypothetical protein LEP1GSC063_1425 [Leptospira santarosai serovar Arenal str. MAVJ 401]MDI7185182.1 hypothetical protein [Leptospira santarosai]MDI7199224.1 hypothetical protein [Leptospira santarosai]MDI7224639.1 hypothetical protein [Leptospira santarosai]MDI7227604.1 hypothetical protein [Leptospira santarosai]
MNQKQLIQETLKYFGKDRKLLRKTILDFSFENKKTKEWNRRIKTCTTHPFRIQNGIFGSVVNNILDKKYHLVYMDNLGDLSWNIKILLNSNIKSGYDWDKNLAVKCGQARILEVYINYIIPAYTLNPFYIIYDQKENYYEFGKIVGTKKHERNILDNIFKLFDSLGYFYVPEELASKKCKGLFSDCNEEGNASLFDCLFSDVNQHQVGIERFLDPCKKLKDSTGAGIGWHEYYDLNGNLLYRQEYRLLKSGDVLSVITDQANHIKKVNVRRKIDNQYREFELDVLKVFKKRISK